MSKDRIIYVLTTEDVDHVARELFDRSPSEKELKFVEEKIGDHISWYGIIEYLLNEYEDESKPKTKMTTS